ncbi:MAG TPA: DNA helicase II, partial [Gammaproteobacteria bacterium]|nr:DNA helicase II [Gammaproteobacteria bacterium]
RVENMQLLQREFAPVAVVRLEQNYRSTGAILRSANAVIAHNEGRLGKSLWTAGDEGEAVRLYTAFNETDEARFVIERVVDWQLQGGRRDEVAILYRSNAQSRVFEEIFLERAIPYRVYGGLRFFERAEIRDALAYLRLLDRRDADTGFERVVNLPPRGIGGRTVECIRSRAQQQGYSLWQAASELADEQQPSTRAAKAVAVFLQLIEDLATLCAHLPLHKQVEMMLAHSGLLEHFGKQKNEKAQIRVENLNELISAARQFTHNDEEPEEGGTVLGRFLDHAALEAGEGQAEKWEDCVQLMSLHAAKGLEFHLVFLTGLEEGLFPHQRSLEEPGRLEEERRLCYVGMTRARQQLVLTHAKIRHLHGREIYARPSRFIKEIPAEYLQEIRRGGRHNKPGRTTVTRDSHATAAVGGMALGSRVRHQKFGDGMVITIEGKGEYARVQVNFEEAGEKWLVLAYANLEMV